MYCRILKYRKLTYRQGWEKTTPGISTQLKQAVQTQNIGDWMGLCIIETDFI